MVEKNDLERIESLSLIDILLLDSEMSEMSEKEKDRGS